MPFPIAVTDEGMLIVSSCVYSSYSSVINALSPIVSSPSFRTTFFRAEHPEKASVPIVFSEDGMVISSSSSQLKNASAPIEIRFSDKITFCSDEDPKAYSPISVTESGITTSVNAHCANVLFSILDSLLPLKNSSVVAPLQL